MEPPANVRRRFVHDDSPTDGERSTSAVEVVLARGNQRLLERRWEVLVLGDQHSVYQKKK